MELILKVLHLFLPIFWFLKGKVYSCSNILDQFKYIFTNFSVVLNMTRNKMNAYKNEMKYRMYKKDVKSKYKYRRRLFIFDYIYVILDVVMVVFYLLKVR